MKLLNKVTVNDIYRKLIKKYPLKYQEKWDESGIKYFGRKKAFIDKILIALDINAACIQFAIKNKIELIIAHHPIFTNSKEIKLFKNDINNLKLLKKHKINVIALHTSIDNHPNGLNWFLVKQISSKNFKQIKNSDGTFFKVNLIKQYSANELITLFKETHDVNAITCHDNGSKIKSIYFCSGSGFGVLKHQLSKLKKDECLVTGDIKWHNWQTINDFNANALDVGHDIEKHFITLISEFIIQNFPKIKIYNYFPNIKLKVTN